MRFGLYPKFILTLVAISVLPVAFVGLRLVGINQKGIQAAVLELHYKLAQKIAERVETYLQTTDEKILFAMQMLEKNLDWQDKQVLLQSLIESHNEIGKIAILNPQGKEVLKVYNPSLLEESKLSDQGRDPEYIASQQTQKKTMRLTPSGVLPHLEMYYPLRRGFGMYVLILPKKLWKEIQEERVGGSGFVFIVNRQGNPVFYPANLINPDQIGSISQRPMVRQALGALAVGSAEFKDDKAEEQVGSFAPISSLGGAVLLQQPKAEAYLAATQIKRQAILFLWLIGFFALGGATYLAGQLSKPILALTKGAEAVARGDFSKGVDASSNDELQDLADTFNRMRLRLREYAQIQVDRIISEQKKTEAILFSIADGILMTDFEGRIQLVNRRARTVLGIPDGPIPENQTIQSLIPDSRIQKILLEVIQNPQENLYRELDFSTDQFKLVLNVSSQTVVAPGKETSMGVVTALHDVTLEKELSKMKEEFLQSITHDLRNPMGAIRGFLEFLLKEIPGPLNPQQKKMIESIDRASFRLLAMINNILDIAKMEAGKMDLKLISCSVTEVATRMIELMESLARRKNIHLEVHAVGPVSLVVDEGLLERVFTNLLGNAIKFTPEDGKVKIHVEDRADAVLCCVEDSGEGIPAEFVQTIFDKFIQVKTQKTGGTGLGLTICKYVVEAHGGKIWAESAVGKGSKFFFSLPKRPRMSEAVVSVPGTETLQTQPRS
ncbi:MAG: HAMP domain-containing protein [Elusimicrobia bacterium]|nr:HAMP domain-containing protein [Elusimicrobiota bacterium]